MTDTEFIDQTFPKERVRDVAVINELAGKACPVIGATKFNSVVRSMYPGGLHGTFKGEAIYGTARI